MDDVIFVLRTVELGDVRKIIRRTWALCDVPQVDVLAEVGIVQHYVCRTKVRVCAAGGRVGWTGAVLGPDTSVRVLRVVKLQTENFFNDLAKVLKFVFEKKKQISMGRKCIWNLISLMKSLKRNLRLIRILKLFVT